MTNSGSYPSQRRIILGFGFAAAQALLSSGNEALRYFAKAATQYARSQAHAMQAYAALVPQPTSPSDIGLRMFGGDWAAWETTVR